MVGELLAEPFPALGEAARVRETWRQQRERGRSCSLAGAAELARMAAAAVDAGSGRRPLLGRGPSPAALGQAGRAPVPQGMGPPATAGGTRAAAVEFARSVSDAMVAATARGATFAGAAAAVRSAAPAPLQAPALPAVVTAGAPLPQGGEGQTQTATGTAAGAAAAAASPGTGDSGGMPVGRQNLPAGT